MSDRSDSVIRLEGLDVVKESVVEEEGTTCFVAVDPRRRRKMLGIRGNFAGFAPQELAGDGLALCALTPDHARLLRRRFEWLNPVALGLSTSMGFGDRLGLATGGHIRAVRNSGLAPVFAQQSVRENSRTGRTPDEVVADAMWAVFEQGWREPWGADADHVKSADVLPLFVNAGYSFFTVDPGEHVDNAAEGYSPGELQELYEALPWKNLETSGDDLSERYLGKSFGIGGMELAFERGTLLHTAVKYGRAVAHVTGLYRALVTLLPSSDFDFEVSVDETDSPTTVQEHYWLASELQRLGVRFVSLAPRFVGRFEKGVDYVGNLESLEVELKRHGEVCRHFGSYKLSLHSGSDKFSVYRPFAKATEGRAHVKTAGTSYLEALRVVAEVDPEFFLEILTLARDRYPEDRRSYHVSARIEALGIPASIREEGLLAVLDSFDGRQILHVTFGSVLASFGNRLIRVIRDHEARYAEVLQRHFARHIEPFTRVQKSQ